MVPEIEKSKYKYIIIVDLKECRYPVLCVNPLCTALSAVELTPCVQH